MLLCLPILSVTASCVGCLSTAGQWCHTLTANRTVLKRTGEFCVQLMRAAAGHHTHVHLSCPALIGFSNAALKSLAVPNSPGTANSMRECSSARLFWTGVPAGHKHEEFQGGAQHSIAQYSTAQRRHGCSAGQDDASRLSQLGMCVDSAANWYCGRSMCQQWHRLGFWATPNPKALACRVAPACRHCPGTWPLHAVNSAGAQ